MAQVQINLLTKEFRNRGVSEGGIKWLVFLVLLGLLSLGGWQFLEYYRLANDQVTYQADLQTLQNKIIPVQQSITRADNVNRMQNLITNLKNSGPAISQLLAAIQSKTPAGINIQSLDIKDNEIDLQVGAAALPYVEEFQDSLAAVKGFSNVQLKSLSQDTGKPVQAALSLNYSKGGWSN